MGNNLQDRLIAESKLRVKSSDELEPGEPHHYVHGAFHRALLREAAAALAQQVPDGDGIANCAECGAFLELVRPGKHQHPTCSMAPQQAPAAPSPDVEAQARELLAAEYERDGLHDHAFDVRNKPQFLASYEERATRAITAALRQQPVQQTMPGVVSEAINAALKDGAGIFRLEYIDAETVRLTEASSQQPVQAAPGAVAEVKYAAQMTQKVLDWPSGLANFLRSAPIGTKLYTGVQAAPGEVAVGDGSPFDLAMRAYELAAYQHGKTDENAVEVNAAAQKVYDLYAAPHATPVVDALLRAAQGAEAFIGVMFGDMNGRVPETVRTPLGIPVKLREIFIDLTAAIEEYQ